MVQLTDKWKKNRRFSNWSKDIINPKRLDHINVLLRNSVDNIQIPFPAGARLMLAKLISIMEQSGITFVLNTNQVEDGFVVRGWETPKQPWSSTKESNKANAPYEFVNSIQDNLLIFEEQLRDGTFNPFNQCYFCPQSKLTHYYNEREFLEYYGDKLSKPEDFELANDSMTARKEGLLDMHMPFLSHYTGSDTNPFAPGAIDLYIEDDIKYKAVLLLLNFGTFGKLSSRQVVSNYIRFYTTDSKGNAYTSTVTHKLPYEYNNHVVTAIQRLEELMTLDKVSTKDLLLVIKAIDLDNHLDKYHHPMFDILRKNEFKMPNIIHIENRMDVMFPGLGDYDDFKSLHANSEYIYNEGRVIREGWLNNIYCEHDQLVTEEERSGVIQTNIHNTDVDEFIV